MPLAIKNNISALNEALDLLQEECAEVIQAVSKIRRFGSNSYHPNDPDTSNLELLQHELGDLELIVNILIDMRYIDEDAIKARMKNKLPKLQKYTNLFERDNNGES